MEGPRRARYFAVPLAGVGVVTAALLFPWCLALGYWNGERRSKSVDAGLFVLALLIPYVITAALRSWVAVVAIYAGAVVVGAARFVMRRRGTTPPGWA